MSDWRHYWTIYITQSDGRTTQHIVDVPQVRAGGDAILVAMMASDHFDVRRDQILAVPTVRKRAKPEAVLVLQPLSEWRPKVRPAESVQRRVVTGAADGPFYIVNRRTGKAIDGPFDNIADADRKVGRSFRLGISLDTHRVVDQRNLPRRPSQPSRCRRVARTVLYQSALGITSWARS